MLLELGAMIEATKGGIPNEATPLWIAAQGGHTAVVKVLYEHGANTEPPEVDNMTPLW